MDTKTRWWTVVQAVIWIVWRNLLLVERASGIRTFAALRRLQETPVSVGDDPPISLAAAPIELIRAAKDGHVGIRGLRRGSEKPESVFPRGYLQTPWLADHGNEVRLINEEMTRTGLSWTDLWVRADDCMNRWPAPAAGAASSASIPATAAQSVASPTYAPDMKYSPDRVPEEFKEWARAQHEAGVIITVPLAEDAMRGAKDDHGKRSGGKLPHGPGLSRNAIREWVRTLPQGWAAEQGIPPSRR